MIPVTKSFLPSIEEYTRQVNRAFQNEWLTNRGELVVELEKKLQNYLGSAPILITNNGTVPLQIAAKLLGKGGEIITTPFSYVATTSAILWENCTPVFVDIDSTHLTIDEKKIEEAITPRTRAILATHVFGNPCNVEAIEAIAQKHSLSVIYDAAHCFGVKYKGQSIFNYGDVSTCSFHATKIFHTGEGGAFFCKDESLMHQLYYSHNFGHNGSLAFHGLGVNGKISELQAAMGLAVLPYMEQILSARKKVVNQYNTQIDFGKCNRLQLRENTEWNYSYYPILFDSESSLLNIQAKLNEKGIMPRRYFYPSLNRLPFLDKISEMPVSDKTATTILCLPLYVGLQEHEVDIITQIVNAP